MATRTLTITLDVRVDDEEIAGEASGDGAAGRPFSGWIGLIAAIDALIGGDRRPLPTDPLPDAARPPHP